MLKVRAVIVEAEGDEATVRAVLDAFVSQATRTAAIAAPPAALPSPVSPPVSAPAREPVRRSAIAAGSPAARVLELAKTEVTRRQLVDQATSIGLRPGTVSALIEQLVASKHLTRSGKSRGTRYVAR